MIETAAVFDIDGNIIQWHTPHNRTSISIPDNTQLWEILWKNREKLGGIAHTHPGSGDPWPSYTDITTFAAIEAALGKRLVWPIITTDRVATFVWSGPKKHDYWKVPILWAHDISMLRKMSEKGE